MSGIICAVCYRKSRQILTIQLTNKGATLKPSSNFPSRNKKKPSKSTTKGEIRLIGGQWRGRRLKVHDKEGLRPTTDRLKETLFNWLMTDVRNAQVLDCFSGAGSLGFEAASRGASQVIAIEKDKQAALQLKENCQALNANTQITVIQGDFFQKILNINEKFDLIFIDPPFHKNLIEPTINALIESEKLKVDTILYIEKENDAAFALENSELSSRFELVKHKVAGQVAAQLFRYLG